MSAILPKIGEMITAVMKLIVKWIPKMVPIYSFGVTSVIKASVTVNNPNDANPKRMQGIIKYPVGIIVKT